jgi:hypothetical protein
MTKSAEYCAKAVEHLQLAQSCQSPEAREVHARMANAFLALAHEAERSRR